MPSPFQLNLDELTLMRLRRGDAAAQTSVFRQFERPVYTLCARLLGDVSQALDALQDSFVQAFGQIDSYRAESPFGLWLRSIVVHRCLREIRDRKWQQSGDVLEELEPFAPAELKLMESIDLQNALARLPMRARMVLWLYHVEGFRHAEIADFFGASESFSKSQLARALQSLRAHFEPSMA